MYSTKNKLFTTILLGAGLSFLFAANVKAAGTVTITADPETAIVGDTITVSYEATSDGDNAEAPQISVEYDENRLSIADSDKDYGGGGGFLSFTDLSATMHFTVLSGGNADVTVSAELDGDGAEVPSASVSVFVDGEDTAAAMEAATGSANTASSTGVEAGTVMSTDGTRIIQKTFQDDLMPSLFHKITISYSGETIEAAQFDMGDLILVYVSDESGSGGNFCIINTDTGELTDFRMLQGIENRFIVVMKAGDDVIVPDGFTRAELQWNGQKFEAYMIEDGAKRAAKEEKTEDGTDKIDPTANLETADFFLVYAYSSEGNKGWYMYDQAEGTYQRYIPIGSSSAQEGFLTNVFGEKSFPLPAWITIAVLAVLLIAALIVILNLALKLKDYQNYDYIDEDDEDEDDEDESYEPISRRNKVKASDLADREFNGSDEEDEDEDEDDEDYFSSKDAKRAQKLREKEEKRREKEARRKQRLGYDEPEEMDWSEIANTMNNQEDDDRRPKGNDASKLPKQYRNNADVDFGRLEKDKEDDALTEDIIRNVNAEDDEELKKRQEALARKQHEAQLRKQQEKEELRRAQLEKAEEIRKQQEEKKRREAEEAARAQAAKNRQEELRRAQEEKERKQREEALRRQRDAEIRRQQEDARRKREEEAARKREEEYYQQQVQQNYNQQQYYQQGFDPNYNQGYQQGYDMNYNQGYQQDYNTGYGQNGYNQQYSQQGYYPDNQQMVNLSPTSSNPQLDEDFEFEFLNLGDN